MLTAAGAGAVGAWLPSGATAAAAILLACYSLGWHACRRTQFWGSRSGRQANRRWALTKRLGRFYFGLVLGLGICTYMTTPLIYALIAYSMFAKLPAALLAGVGFGIGRSRPLFDGLLAQGRLSPAVAADRFSSLTFRDHVLGCLLAVVVIGATVLGPG